MCMHERMTLWRYLLALVCISVCTPVRLPSALAQNCTEPTEENPLSLCVSCSDTSAGVEWRAFPSNSVYAIYLQYSCITPDGDEVTDELDTCFRALPPVQSFSQGRDANMIVHGQHSTGKIFPEGTICNFTATYEHINLFSRKDKFALCTIKSSEECTEEPDSCRIPVECEDRGSDCQCSCAAGYSGYISTNANPHFCQNIDECSLTDSNCHPNATCNDTDGSFTCTCNAGFEGDGANYCTSSTADNAPGMLVDQESDSLTLEPGSNNTHPQPTTTTTTTTTALPPSQEAPAQLTSKMHSETASGFEIQGSTTLVPQPSSSLNSSQGSSILKSPTLQQTQAPAHVVLTTTTPSTEMPPTIAVPSSPTDSSTAIAAVLTVITALIAAFLMVTVTIGCAIHRKKRKSSKALHFVFMSSEKIDPGFEPDGMFAVTICKAESLHSVFNSLKYDSSHSKSPLSGDYSPSNDELLALNSLNDLTHAEEGSREANDDKVSKSTEKSAVSEQCTIGSECESIWSGKSEDLSVKFTENLLHKETSMSSSVEEDSIELDPITEMSTEQLSKSFMTSSAAPGYTTESEAFSTTFIAPFTQRNDTTAQVASKTAELSQSVANNGYVTEAVALTENQRKYNNSVTVAEINGREMKSEVNDNATIDGSPPQHSSSFQTPSFLPIYNRFNSTSSGYYTLSEAGSTPASCVNPFPSTNGLGMTGDSDFYLDEAHLAQHNEPAMSFDLQLSHHAHHSLPFQAAKNSLNGQNIYYELTKKEDILNTDVSGSAQPYQLDSCSIDSGAVCFDFPDS